MSLRKNSKNSVVMMNLQYALLSDNSWQDMARWQTPDTPFMTFEF